MAADVTTLTIRGNDITSLTVTSSDITIIQTGTNTTTNRDVTILNTSSATITVPASLQLSNAIPTELANTGTAGVALTVSRSDHVHPSTGHTVNGGNF